MRISKIDTIGPSFGQVRKCAAKTAIEQTSGNKKELDKVNNLVKG